MPEQSEPEKMSRCCMCKGCGGATVCSIVSSPFQRCLSGLTTICYAGRQVAKTLIFGLLLCLVFKLRCGLLGSVKTSFEHGKTFLFFTAIFRVQSNELAVFSAFVLQFLSSFWQEVEILSEAVFQEFGTWKRYSILVEYFRGLYSLIPIHSSKLYWFWYVDISAVSRLRNPNHLVKDLICRHGSETVVRLWMGLFR